MSWLSTEELKGLGFKSLGENVRISSKCSIYNAHLIDIGSNSRVDDFCVLSPSKSLTIGSHVHLGVMCSLIGAEDIILHDFAGLSGKVSVYSSSDDYIGSAMTNPTVPPDLRCVTSKKVDIGKHVIVGASSIILPGARLELGAAVGALSVVRGRCESFYIYSGNPCKKIRARKKDFLNLERLIDIRA